MHLSPLSPHVSQNLENLLQVFRPPSPGAQPVSRTRAPVFAAQISEENCRVPSCLLQDKEEHSPETVSTLTSAGEGTSTRGSTSRIFFLMLYRTRFPSLTRRASSTSTYQQLLSSQMSRISLTRSCYGLSPKIHTRCLKSLCCSLSFYFIIIFCRVSLYSELVISICHTAVMASPPFRVSADERFRTFILKKNRNCEILLSAPHFIDSDPVFHAKPLLVLSLRKVRS